MRFVHDTLPQRVCFGSGEAKTSLLREITALGVTRVMLIAAKAEMHLADEIAAGIPVALRHDDVVMHVPVEVAERARDCLLYTSDAADDLLCVDLGGRRIIKKKKQKNTHTNKK